MPLYRATATTLANLVAADGSADGFIKDAQASTFGLSLLDDTDARRAAQTMGVAYILSRSAAAVTRNSANAAGDATESAAATITVPAGAMGANGIIRVTTLWTYTSSTNAKNLKVRFGGASGTQFMFAAPTTTASARMQTIIANRNAANSQVGGIAAQNTTGGWGSFGGACVTASLDTTAAQDIVITSSWTGATSGETITLESYLVELLYGA